MLQVAHLTFFEGVYINVVETPWTVEFCIAITSTLVRVIMDGHSDVLPCDAREMSATVRV